MVTGVETHRIVIDGENKEQFLTIDVLRYTLHSVKLGGLVDIPLAFDITPFMYKPGTSRYEAILQSTVMHDGNSVHNGHYVSYVKGNEKWIVVNDDLPVRTLGRAELKINIAEQGVILLYKIVKLG